MKKGYDTGLRVNHPVIEGAELPVFIANFILMEYGTGAIFGCPAHDQRDLEFARAYGLPVVPVVLPPGADAKSFVIAEEAYTGDGALINSGFLDGLTVEAAEEKIAEYLTGKTAKGAPQGARHFQFRLRDWGISRQQTLRIVRACFNSLTWSDIASSSRYFLRNALNALTFPMPAQGG